MRGLLTLFGVSVMIGLAAPAYADPDDGDAGNDVGFLGALQQAGITYPSPGQAIGSGRAVCVCLDHGESGLEIIQDVKTHNPAFNMDAAAQFALISAKYYCPHHLSQT